MILLVFFNFLVPFHFFFQFGSFVGLEGKGFLSLHLLGFLNAKLFHLFDVHCGKFISSFYYLFLLLLFLFYKSSLLFHSERGFLRFLVFLKFFFFLLVFNITHELSQISLFFVCFFNFLGSFSLVCGGVLQTDQGAPFILLTFVVDRDLTHGVLINSTLRNSDRDFAEPITFRSWSQGLGDCCQISSRFYKIALMPPRGSNQLVRFTSLSFRHRLILFVNKTL